MHYCELRKKLANMQLTAPLCCLPSMTTTTETNILPLVTDEQKQAEETWRKSIPAQVFLNYFFAINYHIQENDDATGGLQHLPFFRAHQAELTEADIQAVGKLLQAC